MKKGTRWRHKTYPNSFELVVLNIRDSITYERTRDDGSKYLARETGPFADVIFKGGRESQMRVSDIETLFEEVA